MASDSPCKPIFSKEDLLSKNLPESRSPIVLEFLGTLGKSLNETIRFHQLRATPEGLFVSEQAQDALSDVIEAFLASQNLQGAPEENFLRKIPRGGEERYYLLDGKTCLFGALFRFPLTEQDKLSIPFWRGSLFDAKDYLHLKDPIFQNLEGTTHELNSRGFRISLTNRKKIAYLSIDILSEFGRLARNSKRLLEEEPRLTSALRYAAPLLVRMWGKAKVVRNSDKILIPATQFRNKKQSLLRLGDFVWIQDEDGTIQKCYSTRGKNLHNFLREETQALKNELRGKGFHGFRFQNSGKHLGTLQLENESFFIEPASFKQFFDRIPYSRDLPKRIDGPYTFRLALELYLKVLSQSAWVDVVHVPKDFARQFKAGMNFRSKKNWYFAINRARHVLDCFDSHSPPSSRGTLNASSKPASSKSQGAPSQKTGARDQRQR